jgi:hypothetical protein
MATVPQIDFSPIGSLADVYRGAQQSARKRQALEQFSQTQDPNVLAASGDPTLANMAMQYMARKQAEQRQAQMDARQLERDKISDSRWSQEFALKKQQAADGGGVYGTPIYGTDPTTGETVLGAIGKDGRFRRIDTGGVVPTPGGIKTLDTGTGYVPFDPRRGAVVGGAIPKTGEVSKDYAPVIGPGGAVSATPIPGTPAAQKIEEDQAKAVSRAEQTVAGSGAVKDIITDVRTKVSSAPWYNPAVGFGAETASNIAETNAADTAELIKTVTANIGFDRLQRMREESPTGGALGQVAVQELESLQKTIASLAQRQSKGQFLQNLKRVEDQYDRIIKKAAAYPNAARHGFGKSTDRDLGPSGNDILAKAKDAIARGADPAKVMERLRQNGIDPSGL